MNAVRAVKQNLDYTTIKIKKNTLKQLNSELPKKCTFDQFLQFILIQYPEIFYIIKELVVRYDYNWFSHLEG